MEDDLRTDIIQKIGHSIGVCNVKLDIGNSIETTMAWISAGNGGGPVVWFFQQPSEDVIADGPAATDHKAGS